MQQTLPTSRSVQSKQVVCILLRAQQAPRHAIYNGKQAYNRGNNEHGAKCVSTPNNQQGCNGHDWNGLQQDHVWKQGQPQTSRLTEDNGKAITHSNSNQQTTERSKTCRNGGSKQGNSLQNSSIPALPRRWQKCLGQIELPNNEFPDTKQDACDSHNQADAH